MSILDVLGFHEYDLEEIYERACEIFENFTISDDFENIIIAKCKDSFNWDNPSNSLIEKICETVVSVVKRLLPHAVITYFVNGADSYIAINYEEKIYDLITSSFSYEEIDKILEHDFLLEYDECDVYKSDKEFGEAHDGNSFFDEYEDAEEFAKFLLSVPESTAIKLPTGKIVEFY